MTHPPWRCSSPSRTLGCRRKSTDSGPFRLGGGTWTKSGSTKPEGDGDLAWGRRVLSNLPSYIGHRVLQAVPVLIGVSLASFLLIHVVGGNPAAILLGPHATPKAVAALDRQYGLDRPLVVQYL